MDRGFYLALKVESDLNLEEIAIFSLEKDMDCQKYKRFNGGLNTSTRNDINS